jgi:hypothetical protein
MKVRLIERDRLSGAVQDARNGGTADTIVRLSDVCLPLTTQRLQHAISEPEENE